MRSQQPSSDSPTPFPDRLAAACRRCGNPVVVGLDPRQQQLPAALQPGPGAGRSEVAAAYRQFCCEIIDVVASLVPAVKPQAAFFEQQGPAGMQAMADVVQHASHRGLIVVLDGKRNDIGSTAEAYADAYLGSKDSAWGADALTVSPYLGEDSVTPFIDTAQRRAAGIFVLVKTSNPGGGLFQDLLVDGQPLYQHVANLVERLAAERVGTCGYGDVGAVVGATYPEQLVELRQRMPHTWFLVPGFGSQGGTARDVAAAFDSLGQGALINSSRGIIFAYKQQPYRDQFGDGQWQAAVEAATHAMIDQLRSETPAGQLADT